MSDPQPVIQVVETDVFRSTATEYLSAHEVQALRLYLASNPHAGLPSSDLPGVLVLEWGRCDPAQVLYMIHEADAEIFLMLVLGSSEAKPSIKKDGGNLLRDLLDTAKKVGIGIALKELWESFKEWWS